MDRLSRTDINTDLRSTASNAETKKLKGMLRWQQSKIMKQRLQIRRLQAQNRKLTQKINKIEDVLKVLEDKFSMTSENIISLKNTNVKVSVNYL